MKLSIIISTYNGTKYISDQLESIRNQTRLPDEVLIYDDGSTDDTVRIIQDFIDKYSLSGWHLIRNEKNKGWKQNFKDGILSCQGDLIFPSDQDDIWLPTKLADMEHTMFEKPAINVLVSQYIEFYEDGSEKNLFRINDGSCVQADWRHRLFNVLYPGCTFCIRRSFLSSVSEYWGIYAHDAFLWRFSMLSDSAYILRKPLIRWRKHRDSTFQKEARSSKNFEGKVQFIEFANRVIDDLIGYLKNSNDKEDAKKIECLKKYKKWLQLRNKFYETKNPLYGIRLLSYLKLYARNKQYIGDWVITYIWKR